jgi:hypothetical protein
MISGFFWTETRIVIKNPCGRTNPQKANSGIATLNLFEQKIRCTVRPGGAADEGLLEAAVRGINPRTPAAHPSTIFLRPWFRAAIKTLPPNTKPITRQRPLKPAPRCPAAPWEAELMILQASRQRYKFKLPLISLIGSKTARSQNSSPELVLRKISYSQLEFLKARGGNK